MMFEISFERNNVYQCNIYDAPTKEIATAYFMSRNPDAVFLGVSEHRGSIKPGMPVVVVPDGWKNAEMVVEEIIAYFEENEEIFTDCIEELDGYDGYLGDDRYYYMEDLNELYHGCDPLELLQRAFFGWDEDSYTEDGHGNRRHNEFNPNREYFRYNGYGNLVSSDYKDYSDHLDRYAVERMAQYRAHIDSIESDLELSELFDQLEEASEEGGAA